MQGHPNMHCPGIDIPTGSLGQGFACAVGMAIALKLDKKSARVFSVLGDGECQEGEIWEAAQTANKYQLDNLVVFAIRMHRHNHKPKCIFGHTTKGKGVYYRKILTRGTASHRIRKSMNRRLEKLTPTIRLGRD